MKATSSLKKVTMGTICGLLAAAGLVSVSLGGPGSTADEEAIKKTALDYVEGWYDADAERMERSVHPDLAKRALMPDPRRKGGKIEHMSAMRLVQATRARAGKPTDADQRTAEVIVYDIDGNAATAKAVMHDWIDYLHLSKIRGDWKIVNVLWELTPAAKKKLGFAEQS